MINPTPESLLLSGSVNKNTPPGSQSGLAPIAPACLQQSTHLPKPVGRNVGRLRVCIVGDAQEHP